MENCIKLTLFLLAISEFESQIIISNIKGPSVLQNLSSVNKQGSIVTVINGHVVNQSNASEDNDNIIKGPLVIHGAGSTVTTIQSEQSAGGNVLSVISANNNDLNDDPKRGPVDFIYLHATAHLEFIPLNAALTSEDSFSQNPDEASTNHKNSPGNPAISRTTISVDDDSSKIHFL